MTCRSRWPSAHIYRDCEYASAAAAENVISGVIVVVRPGRSARSPIAAGRTDGRTDGRSIDSREESPRREALPGGHVSRSITAKQTLSRVTATDTTILTAVGYLRQCLLEGRELRWVRLTVRTVCQSLRRYDCCPQLTSHSVVMLPSLRRRRRHQFTAIRWPFISKVYDAKVCAVDCLTLCFYWTFSWKDAYV